MMWQMLSDGDITPLEMPIVRNLKVLQQLMAEIRLRKQFMGTISLCSVRHVLNQYSTIQLPMIDCPSKQLIYIYVVIVSDQHFGGTRVCNSQFWHLMGIIFLIPSCTFQEGSIHGLAYKLFVGILGRLFSHLVTITNVSLLPGEVFNRE